MNSAVALSSSMQAQQVQADHSIWRTSIRFTLLMTLALGIGYPLVLTAIAGVVFPHKAAGSLIERNGQVEPERLALFVRYMLTVNAPLALVPEDAQ